MMKRLIPLLTAVVVTLSAAASAFGSAPVIFTATRTVSTPDFNFSCNPYGYSFDTLATFTVTRHFIQFYDANGNLTKEIRHIDFTGTLYRSDDLSKTIPYAGTWTRTIDVQDRTPLDRFRVPSWRGFGGSLERAERS